MSDYIVEQLSILGGKGLDYLRELIKRLKKADKATQKNIFLGTLVLVLGAGIFFYSLVNAQGNQRKMSGTRQPEAETVDPLSRIGQGIQAQAAGTQNVCRQAEQVDVKNRLDPAQLRILLAGSPMERMIPALSKRGKATAAFLVAIARKESSWGEHSPKKSGRECFNYWGYKGGYNPVEGGYSCFDSPEQAVAVVGNRIDKLIGQRIDTPARMVVWKCGGSCAATGGQAAADKWVSDVAGIYKKLALE